MARIGVSGNTSDENFDKICSKCKEQTESIEAEKYCVDCHDYYCAECLKSHSTFPALRGHKLLDAKAAESGKLIMVPTERCNRHNYKPVDMFCQNHDVVGCGTCIAVDHRTCQDVFYIPEFVSTKPNVLSEFQQRMTTIKNSFTGFLETFEGEGVALETNKQNEIYTIRSNARKLKENIRNAERDAVSKVETRNNKLQAKLNEDIVKVKDELQKFLLATDCINSKQENKSQAFVALKLNQSRIATAESTCEDISLIKLGRRVHFTIDPKYEELCTGRICMGAASIPYSFTHSGTVNVKLSSDTKTCDVYGSCVLSSGSLVFADQANKSIKLVDSINLNVIHHYTLGSAPSDVCYLETNEIGVCLPSEKKIKIFKVCGKLFPKSEISLTFPCRGMSYMDNIFYISDNKCIKLCDWEGTVVKTIPADVAKNANISNIYHVFVSDHSKNIFVTDCTSSDGKGAACLDNDGKILNVVSDEIAWAHGVADAGNGKAFACGFTSNNVILLSENGEFESVIIKTGLTAPQSLCFDIKNGRLFVANYSSDDVQIFESE